MAGLVCWRVVWQGVYQVVESQHGRDCLLKADMAGVWSGGEGEVLQGLSVGGGVGRACIR
jgi:hypothetical protein